MITPETFSDFFAISSINRDSLKSIHQRIDQKTKPPGSLGQLESLAARLALILDAESIQIKHPTLLLFAADHGIADNGISIAPSDVTRQMVMNFLNGGAAINCFCDTHGLAIKIIDAGIKNPLDDTRLINQSLGRGTHDFSKQAAMTNDQAAEGLLLGKKIAETTLQTGVNVLGFGEMGIGNSSAAAAIMAAILNIPADECVGRGTGIDDKVFQKKLQLIEQALRLHADQLDCPLDILTNLGGFEIAQMAGAMLATAASHKVILVDGFIATAAALIAHRLAPQIVDYMVFCHQSNEQGHQRMLNHLGGRALLSLDMRLGEGTGAALALPLLQAAASFYNNMASFEQAQVTPV